MGKVDKGPLMIIGGAEDKKNKRVILQRFIEMAGKEQAYITVVTAATLEPEEMGLMYKEIFTELGAGRVEILDVRDKQQANDYKMIENLEEATAVFFTGGDQLRITSLLGGTMLDGVLQKAFSQGILIGGTSAGASVMSDVMIAEGVGDRSPVMNTVKMAPGLGFLPGVVIDQHFAQRGRIGRLLTAVAQNPRVLGIGIDEDTALIVQGDTLKVIGSQTVTVLDGQDCGESNVSEISPDEPLAITDIKMHILPQGYTFDLRRRLARRDEV